MLFNLKGYELRCFKAIETSNYKVVKKFIKAALHTFWFVLIPKISIFRFQHPVFLCSSFSEIKVINKAQSH